VKKLILVAAFIVALFSLAVAQDTKSMPPVTAIQVVRGDTVQHSNPTTIQPPWPIFCHTKATCLYYAGDFDSTASDANGLFNANDTGGGLEGQTWVGVKPTANATVTGVTFNEFFVSAGVGTNPTPFQTQTNITLGNAGQTVCNTSGNATEAVYGEGDFGLTQYSYTVKKLKKSCMIPKASKTTTTYVNLVPTFSNSYGYTVNVQDPKPKKHIGWKNDLNDCFFNGAAFGATYVTCNSQGIGSTGFTELSIALTGTE
jgi:opacity protein-like surface antigen